MSISDIQNVVNRIINAKKQLKSQRKLYQAINQADKELSKQT
ncbi:hypothetical protein [Staphylococcus saccharolyticus]|nr:hypothetical protein [Staphylococcus saccharolyticus]